MKGNKMTKEEDYKIAWQSASFNNDPKALKKLIDEGMNVNIKSEYNEQLIHSCIASTQNESTECLELLINAGADVNAISENKFHPLVEAIERRNPDGKRYLKTNGVLRYVTLLIDAGADINHVDSDGNGLLYHASLHWHRDVFDLLIKRGVVDVANKEGRTAEDFCMEGGRKISETPRYEYGDTLRNLRWANTKPTLWDGKLTATITFNTSYLKATTEEEAKDALEDALHDIGDIEVVEVTESSVSPDYYTMDRNNATTPWMKQRK